eukprot:1169007-Pleurochrysis_carterae.AAC.1
MRPLRRVGRQVRKTAVERGAFACLERAARRTIRGSWQAGRLSCVAVRALSERRHDLARWAPGERQLVEVNIGSGDHFPRRRYPDVVRARGESASA